MLLWRITFVAAGVWTLIGAIPAFTDPASTFARFYGAPASSTLTLDIFTGSWGQSLLFAIGYLIAALNPRRHIAVVALGGIGKIVYAIRLIAPVAAGTAGPVALVAIIGDLAFGLLFAAFFVVVRPWRVQQPGAQRA